MKDKRVIVALDSDDKGQLLKLVKDIKNEVFAFKIGYEFFLILDLKAII